MKRRCAIVLLSLAPSVAFAITDLESNASLPFSFANPGARSLAMGGAFIGLADDATAAYTNPAGLTQLVQPEVSLELRRTRFDVPYLNGGTIATLDPYDLGGAHYSRASSSASRPSFAAFVYPHERWALALYRHEVSNYDGTFNSDGADLAGRPGIRPFLSEADVRIVDYSAAFAWKLGDTVSLGAGLGYYQFRFDTLTGRFNAASGVLESVQAQEGDDHAIGYNLGARFRFDEHWSAGIVYRHAPEFRYRALNLSLVHSNGQPRAEPLVLNALNDVRFDVPDVFGAGLSWRPNEQFVLDLDIDRVRYAELTDDMQTLFNDAAVAASRLAVSDGYELRLGAEYTFAQFAHPFSLRAGAYREPRHAIRFSGQPDVDDQPQLVKKALFGGAQDHVNHFSLGAGWAFSQFQIDLAADWSNEIDSYSMSGVYRF